MRIARTVYRVTDAYLLYADKPKYRFIAQLTIIDKTAKLPVMTKRKISVYNTTTSPLFR